MRIVAVQFYLVPTQPYPTFRWRTGLPGSEPIGIGGVLRLMTDEGIDGIAYTQRGKIVADLVERRLRAELLGARPPSEGMVVASYLGDRSY